MRCQLNVIVGSSFKCYRKMQQLFIWRPGGGGGRVLGLIFPGFVPLASQNPYLVYYVAKHRPPS